MIEFSVVVHTYNRSRLLGKTLEAISAQSYPAAELILIDDGSQDDTGSIVREQFPNFRYVRISNVGCGAARRAGAEIATKEWIAFCDDDDVWDSHHLQSRAELIKRFPSAGFTCSNFTAFGSAAAPNYNHFATAPDGWCATATDTAEGHFRLLNSDAYVHCLRFNPAYALVWAVRREIYNQIGGINPRYSRWQAEDTDFFRRCLLATRLACDSRVTAQYNRHDSNMSSTKFLNWVKRADILEEQLKAGIVPSAYHPHVIREIGTSRRTACLQAFWAKKYSEAVQLYADVPSEHRDRYLQSRRIWSGLLTALKR